MTKFLVENNFTDKVIASMLDLVELIIANKIPEETEENEEGSHDEASIFQTDMSKMYNNRSRSGFTSIRGSINTTA